MKWQKRCVLGYEDLAPSRDDARVLGVFNPGAIRIGDTVHLMVRVAEQPIAPEGRYRLPRFRRNGELVIDDHAAHEVREIDARVAIDPTSGHARLTSVSHLRHYHVDVDRIEEPSAYVASGHAFWPDGITEAYGVEDPRLTRVGDRIVMTYVSVSRHGACTSLALTEDFESFERAGVIFPNENKDVLILPTEVGETGMAFHRPVSSTPFGTPEMWYADSIDGRRFGNHRPIEFDTAVPSGPGRGDGAADSHWASGRIGGGTVPIRTAEGWLHMFHGNEASSVPGQVGRYCGALMLNDADSPWRVRAVSGPVLQPTESFEREGFVPSVVFPTAWIDVGDRVAIFYGAADERVAVATIDRKELLAELS